MLAILVPVALSQGQQRNKVAAAGEQPKSRRPASSRSRRTSTPHPSQRLPPGGRHLRRPRAGEAPPSSKLLVTGNPGLGKCKPAETSATTPEAFGPRGGCAEAHHSRVEASLRGAALVVTVTVTAKLLVIICWLRRGARQARQIMRNVGTATTKPLVTIRWLRRAVRQARGSRLPSTKVAERGAISLPTGLSDLGARSSPGRL